MHVHHRHALSELPFTDLSGIILRGSDRDNEAMLQQLRKSKQPDQYLLPVFLHQPPRDRSLEYQVDGIWDTMPKYQMYTRVQAIRARMNELQAHYKTGNEDWLRKTLQYLYTREQPLRARRDRTVSTGYGYPFLGSLPVGKDPLRLLQQLDKQVKAGYLTPTLVDKVNLCRSCQGSYLNFRETCAQCGAIDLEVENLIHHFRCAYVGPESDFQQDHQLVCPKCDKKLRHIGIDYDKPSEISSCRRCGHQAQDTPMQAACVDCGEQMPLEAITTRSIHNFALTPLGEQAAVEGLTKNIASCISSSQPIGVIGWDFFQILLQQEVQRARLRPDASFMGCISLRVEAFDRLGSEAREMLRREILQIIRSYLRPVDTLSSADFSRYAFVLPEITEQEAAHLENILQHNLQKLLGDNVVDVSDLVEVSLQPLTPKSAACILS